MVCVLKVANPKIINKRCCPSCHRAYEKRRRDWTSEVDKRKWYIKKKYNLSVKDYMKMFDDQNGQCAVCSRELNLLKSNNGKDTACVDHNHTTGKIRGLLCNHCNRALGLLKEDIEVMKKLITYLETHNG